MDRLLTPYKFSKYLGRDQEISMEGGYCSITMLKLNESNVNVNEKMRNRTK